MRASDLLKLCHCLTCPAHCRCGSLLCAACRVEITHALHPRTHAPEQVGPVKLYSMGEYSGAYAKLIKIAKAQPFGNIDYGLRQFLRELCQHWCAELKHHDRCQPIMQIAAIPSHPVRGFFQSDLGAVLAAECARALKVPVLTGVLKHKSWNPRAQKGLSRAERLSGPQGGRFRVDTRRLSAAHSGRLLLVDDICTTSATLRECAELLRNTHQFSSISALVFARRSLFA